MGSIWTKIWGKPTTKELLEKIADKLSSIEEFKRDTQAWHKRLIGYLLLYFSSIYFIAAVIVYFKYYLNPDWQDVRSQLKLFTPFFIAPFIFWTVKRFLTWWYHRKLKKNEAELIKLREAKKELLEEVMEKETYKVAKELLEKYGTAEQKIRTPHLTPITKSQSEGMRRRQTTAVQSSQVQTPSGYQGNPSLRHTQSFRGSPGPSRPLAAAGPVAERGDSPAESLQLKTTQRRPGPQGPPLPRPVLPRERGYMDRVVEYLVGDGPSNRYALICKQCQSHNGMALKEEFEYISYRCCYCFYWNPARKQRPSAPKLPMIIPRKDSTDSKDSEDEPTERKGSAPPDISGTKQVETPTMDRVVGVEAKGDKDCETAKDEPKTEIGKEDKDEG